MEEYELFVSCLAGLEKALAAELKSLGLAHVRPLGGGVAAAGGVSDALRTCLWSRIASRVMLVVGRANAGDANLLYEGACRMLSPCARMAPTKTCETRNSRRSR